LGDILINYKPANLEIVKIAADALGITIIIYDNDNPEPMTLKPEPIYVNVEDKQSKPIKI